MSQTLFTCMNCLEEFLGEQGIFCMKTTPYYPYTNCDLTLAELIDIARSHDARTADPEDRISSYIRYDDAESPPSRVDLCSILGTKLRLDAPANKHFICSAPGTNGCLNTLVLTYLQSDIQASTWNGVVPCCANLLNSKSARQACESHYDTADLVEHLNRPTRIRLQRELQEATVRDVKKAYQAKEEMVVKTDASAATFSMTIQEACDTMNDLVVPRCPYCKAQFVEWTNCYSVECSNCKKDFCGVCLTYYGTSAEVHNHIKVNCLKHEQWREQNPTCDPYGSSPSRSPMLYIRVQTNQAPWVAERRLRYPMDPFLNAPTILERLLAFFVTIPMEIRMPVLERIWKDAAPVGGGTKKTFVVEEYVYDRAGNLVGYQPIPQLSLDTQFSVLLANRYQSNSGSKWITVGMWTGIWTIYFSDNFFPLSLFTFIPSVFFYNYLFDMKREDKVQYRLADNARISLAQNGQRGSKETLTLFPLSFTPVGYTHVQFFAAAFRYVLAHYKAVIAGGFVLSSVDTPALPQKTGQDIDCYVHASKVYPFYQALLDLGFSMDSWHLAPVYDDSFMRKNHITGRIHLNHLVIHQPVDLMIIPDHIPLKSVVTNFDLTFCQIWYDGNSIESSHPEDVRTKTGSLQPLYEDAYLAGNLFLHKRIEKYRQKGYLIRTPQLYEDTGVPGLLRKRSELNSEHHRRWQLVKDAMDAYDDVQLTETEDEFYTYHYKYYLPEFEEVIKKLKSKKTVTELGHRTWAITKLYQTLLEQVSYKIVPITEEDRARGYRGDNKKIKTNDRLMEVWTSYPLVPVTLERLQEICLAIRVDIKQLVTDTFVRGDDQDWYWNYDEYSISKSMSKGYKWAWRSIALQVGIPLPIDPFGVPKTDLARKRVQTYLDELIEFEDQKPIIPGLAETIERLRNLLPAPVVQPAQLPAPAQAAVMKQEIDMPPAVQPVLVRSDSAERRQLMGPEDAAAAAPAPVPGWRNVRPVPVDALEQELREIERDRQIREDLVREELDDDPEGEALANINAQAAVQVQLARQRAERRRPDILMPPLEREGRKKRSAPKKVGRKSHPTRKVTSVRKNKKRHSQRKRH